MQTQADNRPSIIIIGTGFGGLGMAIQLRKAGYSDFILLEKAEGVGGTWRDNTYPGAACDVQSHLYSYSFEPKHDWSRKFGHQREIRQYMVDCVQKYNLGPHIHFNQEVSEARFDAGSHRWIVHTRSGDRFEANVLITATGQLNQPAYPRIQGLDSFQGHAFHSARWDHDHDFAGKRVAVIGTGASAIQFVPEILPQVARLKLFQRSAAWVIPKPDRPFKPVEQWLFKHLPGHDRLYRNLIYWKNESRALAFTKFNFLLELFAWQAKRELRKHVKDPVKLEKLVPDYKIGCKRVLISNDWAPAMNQEHLELITTPITRVTPKGILTEDGQEHEVDTIIYGTGFKATDFLSPMTITGAHGQDLNAAWRQGAEAYKGITVNGFPNLFMLYGPNTNLAHNSIIFMLESQIRYVLSALSLLQKKGSGWAMQVRPERQSEYVESLQESLRNSVWEAGCTSWYRNEQGRNTVNWPGFTFTYRLATREVDPEDYELRPAAADAPG
ncbi:MAG: NAD(P)/FAD-dependent oxidoreductase [Marinobacter sp.]|uniref:flavin-containing monooxygenase n=1 Tax=Marinobacter sp. TaxID=50741 RepID=UPI00299D8C3B|nr:NAD(P)/FAD-dependent oxidoreductase [Marinobacter sp.]MDX1634088.1 NAD(P)/FAD-dependent oxidoreductase [Marinobacter sp.]